MMESKTFSEKFQILQVQGRISFTRGGNGPVQSYHQYSKCLV